MAQCGEAPVNDAGELTLAAKTWSDAMVGFSPADVHRGLQALLGAELPSEWPPTLPQFRKLCMAPGVSKVPAHQPAFPVGHVIRKYIEKHGDPNTYSPLVVVSMLLAFEVTADDPEGIFSVDIIRSALADSHSCAQALSQAHPEARARMTDNLQTLQSRYA